MKRDEFLKKIAVGMGVAVVTPTVLIAKDKPTKDKKEPSVAIDVNSITGFVMGGRKLNPSEIMRLWRQTGILVYSSNHGHPPIVLDGEIEVIDVAR